MKTEIPKPCIKRPAVAKHLALKRKKKFPVATPAVAQNLRQRQRQVEDEDDDLAV